MLSSSELFVPYRLCPIVQRHIDDLLFNGFISVTVPGHHVFKLSTFHSTIVLSPARNTTPQSTCFTYSTVLNIRLALVCYMLHDVNRPAPCGNCSGIPSVNLQPLLDHQRPFSKEMTSLLTPLTKTCANVYCKHLTFKKINYFIWTAQKL